MYSGSEAVFRALVSAERRGRLMWMYARFPGFAVLTESAYRIVAANRNVFSVLTRLLWGAHVERPTYFLTRWLFLRLMGIIYLIAFASLWTQIHGLAGSRGIFPAEEFMNLVRTVSLEHNGWHAIWLTPTLCWFSASDGFLTFLCAGGVVLSLLVIAGVATAPALAFLWAFYLSLSAVCNVFLHFQWDALLLETGFLAIFFAPCQLVPRLSKESPPPRLALWMLRWLLFRLMFLSGVVKLASGDLTWHDLTALTFHYETQPLPPWTAWYAHQLPAWFQKFSCAAMFGIELGAPWLIFTPRRTRFAGCAALVFLQVLIIVTGNYCFFNLLTITLCVLLLDDTLLRRFAPRKWRGQLGGAAGDVRRVVNWLFVPIAAAILLVSVINLLATTRWKTRWSRTVRTAYMHVYQTIAPFRSVNGYGLFAVMTTERPEIIIEGSNDGAIWHAYEFKYKPGDLMKQPGFVAPHQPRLDWQMWFAALGDYQDNPWLMNLCGRLLEGSPQVLDLLAHNPFPAAPPRYIRAVVYDYHFTDSATRRAIGAWWRREWKGPYCPVLSLNRE